MIQREGSKRREGGERERGRWEGGREGEGGGEGHGWLDGEKEGDRWGGVCEDASLSLLQDPVGYAD